MTRDILIESRKPTGTLGNQHGGAGVCPFCQSKGDSIMWGPRYHACGTMKYSGPRDAGCYELELLEKEKQIAALKERLEAWRQLWEAIIIHNGFTTGELQLEGTDELTHMRKLGEIE